MQLQIIVSGIKQFYSNVGRSTIGILVNTSSQTMTDNFSIPTIPSLKALPSCFLGNVVYLFRTSKQSWISVLRQPLLIFIQLNKNSWKEERNINY